MRTLHAFDLDDTLFYHAEDLAKVHVVENGKRVRTIHLRELAEYRLKSGQSFDFSDFSESSLFVESAKPLKRSIGMLRKRLSIPGYKVEIVTARSDMTAPDDFLKHLSDNGISRRVHVRRAGNRTEPHPPDRKYKILSDLIRKHRFREVHFYDDSPDNLAVLRKLKAKFPAVSVFGHLAVKTPTKNVIFKTRRY